MHRGCLDEWRVCAASREAFLRCDVCLTEYLFRAPPPPLQRAVQAPRLGLALLPATFFWLLIVAVMVVDANRRAVAIAASCPTAAGECWPRTSTSSQTGAAAACCLLAAVILIMLLLRDAVCRESGDAGEWADLCRAFPVLDRDADGVAAASATQP